MKKIIIILLSSISIGCLGMLILISQVTRDPSISGREMQCIFVKDIISFGLPALLCCLATLAVGVFLKDKK